MSTPTVHIAGLHIRIDMHVRQRCAWCEAILVDFDLGSPEYLLADPGLEEHRTWPAGALVLADGSRATIVEPIAPDDDLPLNACARLYP